ncbi:hypothetical protein LCGC14_1943000 [marine sediment metagenome]|uniref:Uncharacterized protein n=1 Tax=marine sediment metagenome TaxID=412755 RepID=A0A0F9FK10_9ZZZZ
MKLLQAQARDHQVLKHDDKIKNVDFHSFDIELMPGIRLNIVHELSDKQAIKLRVVSDYGSQFEQFVILPTVQNAIVLRAGMETANIVEEL